MGQLDAILDRFSQASATEHPWTDREDSEAMGEAFAQFSQGIVAFVAVARKEGGIGYTDARAVLAHCLDFLPPEEEDGFANLIHFVKKGA